MKPFHLLQNLRKFLAFISFLLLLSLIFPSFSHAASVSLNLQGRIEDDMLVAQLRNTGVDPAQGIYLEIEFLGEKSGICFRNLISPGQSAQFSIPRPRVPAQGSYPYVLRATYLNDHARLGVLHVDRLNFGREALLSFRCPMSEITLRHFTGVSLPLSDFPLGTRAQMQFLPHAEFIQSPDSGKELSGYLFNRQPEFQSEGAIFSIFELQEEGLHKLQICGSQLRLLPKIQSQTWYSTSALVCLAIAGFLLSFRAYLFTSQPSEGRIAFIRWTFSVATCSTLYLFFRSAGLFADQVGSIIRWADSHQFLHPEVKRIANVLSQRLYFLGGDYEGFFGKLCDPLLTYMLVGNFFVIRWLIQPNPTTDKYWNFLARVFSSKLVAPLAKLLRPSSGRTREEMGFSRSLSNVALLALMVKAFYLPMIWSWTMNNIHHLNNVAHTPTWNYFVFMKAIIDLMIFIDVGIFAFGYAIELPFLKNTIRSVEPTWFGWFICLICYPPLNEAFFPLANYNLNATWPVWGEATRAAVTLIVALLWTNYTWASVALGFKASNLTNRGVVDTGPYRFVRHPAYVSKCTLWVLSCFFLGEGYGVNILFAIAVYTLRALTEERHLLRDPEYVAYRKRVRWMFCPGIV